MTASSPATPAGSSATSATSSRRAARSAPAPSPGRTPVGALPVGPLAILLALLVIAAGVVLLRDVLVHAGTLRGEPLTDNVLRAIDGLEPQTWMVPAGAGIALLGLWWVLAALLPRRRSELALGGSGLVWIRPDDAARLASDTATHVPGVAEARSSANRRRITVSVVTTGAVDQVKQQVTQAVTERLRGLAPEPAIRVRTRVIGGQR